MLTLGTKGGGFPTFVLNCFQLKIISFCCQRDIFGVTYSSFIHRKGGSKEKVEDEGFIPPKLEK